MSLVVATALKRHYGAQEVLRGAELRIERGDRIGCVGRNGGGKSTLLRLIEGEETPDEGSVVVARGARLGYVPQRPAFQPGQSVRAYVESGLGEARRVQAELEGVLEAMGDAQGADLERLLARQDQLSQAVEAMGAWDLERKVELVLSGIGLSPALWEREARTLSGGEGSRTALARELVAAPDLLLLDEPTNHLDLAGIEWLEDYLNTLQGAVFIVSHDRRLLDRVVTVIVDLEFGTLTRYPGNYSRYLELRQERFESERRAWEKQRDLIRREEAFVRKHMGSQRTAEAKGRQKKLRHIERLNEPRNDVRRPVLKPPLAERGGELVLEAEGLAAGYGERVLFEGVDLRIGRGDRIGIVGANGTGKSTLLKILAGRQQPTEGEVRPGHKAICGYYDQETSGLRADATPYMEIRRDHPELTDLEIRNHLALFLFRGEDVDASVSSLSGGERARLTLAKLLLSSPTWLCLDEPTNHLDLASRTALEEMLSGFDGALVCVSHDREFLDGLCTQIVAIEAGGTKRTLGNYSEYVRKRDAARLEAESEKQKAKEREREAEKRRVQKAKQAGNQTPKKGKKKNPWRLKKLEQEIIVLEEEREALQAAVATEAVYRDADRMRESQFRLAEIERDLEQKNLEWESFI